jgi:hypothetical protein
MIGIAAEHTLATACERRVGQRVRVASPFHVRRVVSPDGRAKPRKPEPMVVALTDTDIWFLEYRYRVVGFTIGAPLNHWRRRAVVANWRYRWWGWPSVWRLELSWPTRAFYIEGDVMGGPDADLMMGLMAADDLHRSPTAAAATAGRP